MSENNTNYFYVNLGQIIEPNIERKQDEKKRHSRRIERRTRKEVNL